MAEDSSAPRPIRWGCVGTGQIAFAMAQQLSRLPDAQREVICSASGKPAAAIEAERSRYGFARAADSLQELIADPAVDVVYIASANTAHASQCLVALQGGKPVLCEKPMTMSTVEADAVFDEAQSRNLLLVDGTFSSCLPAFDAIREALPSIGNVTHVELHKKIKLKIMQESPIINKRSFGGGLFDGCGSYTTHALCVIFGAEAVAALRPEDVEVTSAAGPNGEVDWDTTATLRMLGGATAVLTHRAADDARTSVVHGDSGKIEFELPRLPWVAVNGEKVDAGYTGDADARDLPEGEPGAPCGLHPGLGMQAAAVQRALRAGATSAEWLPPDVMRSMAHAMDLIRHCIPTHLHYEGAVSDPPVGSSL